MNTGLAGCIASAPKGERILVLDVLRGISVLGIAFINIMFFAMPISRTSEWSWANVSTSEGLTRAAVTFLVEGQFLPIFSMLFGMGLGLQYQKVSPTDRSFVWQTVRRLLVLLAIGVAHGILLWFGDILALYALFGFIILWLRNRSPRTLLISGVILFMVPVAIQVLFAFPNPWGRSPTMDEARAAMVKNIRGLAAAQTHDRTTASMSADRVVGTGFTDGQADAARRAVATERAVDFINFLADDQSVYRSGDLKRIILHRSIYFLVFSPAVALMYMDWRVLGMMLLGMYLFRRGWFWRGDHPADHYRRLAIFGLIPGLVLQTASLVIHVWGLDYTWVCSLETVCYYLGSAAMSLGYMGIIYLLYQHSVWQQRLRPFVAVGQMSLTVYLSTSLVFGLIFYGYGLGLMGRISVAMMQLVALVVLSALTAISVLWLRYFQYGPMEWLWRVLTYWRLMPILRPRNETELATSSAR